MTLCVGLCVNRIMYQDNVCVYESVSVIVHVYNHRSMVHTAPNVYGQCDGCMARYQDIVCIIWPCVIMLPCTLLA